MRFTDAEAVESYEADQARQSTRCVSRIRVFSLDAGRRVGVLVKYFNKSQSEALPASCFWMKILRKRMETIVSSGARTEHLIVLIGQ